MLIAMYDVISNGVGFISTCVRRHDLSRVLNERISFKHMHTRSSDQALDVFVRKLTSSDVLSDDITFYA